MGNDGIEWNGPACPTCGRELDVEAVASGETLKVAYSCAEHGAIAVGDPFDL